MIVDRFDDLQEVLCDRCTIQSLVISVNVNGDGIRCPMCQSPMVVGGDKPVGQCQGILIVLYPDVEPWHVFGRIRWWGDPTNIRVEIVAQGEHGPVILPLKLLSVVYEPPAHTVVYSPRFLPNGTLSLLDQTYLALHPEWGMPEQVCSKFDAYLPWYRFIAAENFLRIQQ